VDICKVSPLKKRRGYKPKGKQTQPELRLKNPVFVLLGLPHGLGRLIFSMAFQVLARLLQLTLQRLKNLLLHKPLIKHD
jgi:hypothetical protein